MILPHRVAGNLALDFANTVSWRDTPRAIDVLATPDGLRAWAQESGLSVPGDTSMPTAFLTIARDLRDAVNDVGAAIADQAAVPASAALHLRDVLAATLGRAQLSGRPLQPLFASEDRLFGSVAWSALELFGGAEMGRIKACPFHDCRWLFVDRSKNRSRRWCEMNTCGNRAKKLALID